MPVSPGRHAHRLGRCGPHAPTDEPTHGLHGDRDEDPGSPLRHPLPRGISFEVTVWIADQTATIMGQVRLGAGQVSLLTGVETRREEGFQTALATGGGTCVRTGRGVTATRLPPWWGHKNAAWLTGAVVRLTGGSKLHRHCASVCGDCQQRSHGVICYPHRHHAASAISGASPTGAASFSQNNIAFSLIKR